MIFTPHEFAREVAAQLGRTDLGVTNTTMSWHDGTFAIGSDEIIVRLDNGQEFLVSVRHWGGPTA